MKYTIRQTGKADREFLSSTDALRHLVTNPGYAKLFAGDELVMTKGFPPTDA